MATVSFHSAAMDADYRLAVKGHPSDNCPFCDTLRSACILCRFKAIKALRETMIEDKAFGKKNYRRDGKPKKPKSEPPSPPFFPPVPPTGGARATATKPSPVKDPNSEYILPGFLGRVVACGTSALSRRLHRPAQCPRGSFRRESLNRAHPVEAVQDGSLDPVRSLAARCKSHLVTPQQLMQEVLDVRLHSRGATLKRQGLDLVYGV